ncbi:MAG: DUF4430 domain-containing protein [Dehalococcoidia bacterium]|nr:MAG: DUF4430 domain-containing protein [Dehalococcoidia bacterium]
MTKRIIKSKLFSILLIFTLLLPCLLTTPAMAGGPYPSTTSDSEVAGALNYLRGQQGADGSISDFATSAWAVMAIAAAGEDPHSWQVGSNPTIVDYLTTNAGSASSTNDYSRMILAIAAVDEEPTNFGGVNFLSQLQATYDGSQIGNISLLNDDFWGVIALISAGEDPASTIIQDSVSFILTNQNGDGGWSWGVGQASDADDTAAAIMALIATGQSAGSAPITDALAYIKSTQMDNGGFESWGSTNSATDSWGIDSIVASGGNPTSTGWQSGLGNDPLDDLLSFQNQDGSFNWTPATPSNKELMTSYAITALLGVPYPVAILQAQQGVAVDVRIEGQSSTVWSGTVTVNDSTIIDDQGKQHYLGQPTALGALDEASQLGGFPYVVQDTAYGLYIYSINGEEPAGMAGWMFRVNYSSPMVGATDFILDQTTPPNPPHQEVLFAYSEWGQSPLKVEADNTEPDADDTFTVTVTEYDDDTGTWLPTDNATVHADQDYTTGQDGTVAITINRDMTVEVYAEKEGHIRSNRVTIVVGEGSAQPGDSEGVSMAADILPAISFSISPSSINFGELGPGDTSDPVTITLTNEGAWNLLITASVTDTTQNLYVEGLELDGVKWDVFNTTVLRDGTADCDATLTVPETYTLTGKQNGTIIFWASEAP